MKTLLPCTPQECLIPGPAGELEILMNCPKQAGSLPMPYGIICHPHPLFGGTMMNKVVYMIASAFNTLGVGSVRFNFRGVGKSQGHFDQGEGEIQDIIAVVNWLRYEYAPSEIWLAGFSFGGYVAIRAHQEVSVNRLLLIAPAVTQQNSLQLKNIPTLVIQGKNDDVIPYREVAQWVAIQVHPPLFECLPDADHFFHGKLSELRDIVTKAWA